MTFSIKEDSTSLFFVRSVFYDIGRLMFMPLITISPSSIYVSYLKLLSFCFTCLKTTVQLPLLTPSSDGAVLSSFLSTLDNLYMTGVSTYFYPVCLLISLWGALYMEESDVSMTTVNSAVCGLNGYYVLRYESYQLSDICPHSSTDKLAAYDCSLIRPAISTPVNAHQLLYMHHSISMFRTVTQDRTLSLLNRFHYQVGRYLSHPSYNFLGLDSWTLGLLDHYRDMLES